MLGKNSLGNEIDKIEWPPNLEELHLSHNNIKKIPESIFSLKKLKVLWIAGNLIESVPEQISQLQKLQKIFINRNSLNDLPEAFYNLKNLKGLYVENNPLKEIPIYDWKGNKLDEWKTYYRELLAGETKNYKAKLIFLGQGETGKSTLMSKLMDPKISETKLKESVRQTQGINTAKLDGLKRQDVDGKEYNIEISMWDFGGARDPAKYPLLLFDRERALPTLVDSARS